MKKQKQNQPAMQFWKTLLQPRHIVWVVVFFVTAAVFSWWCTYAYANSSWAVYKFYLSGHESTLTTAGEGATDEMETSGTRDNQRLLDGIVVDQSLARYWPYAVMIENLMAVRPQKGLSQASIVYETLAEGGSTRFMAVFDPQAKVKEIMPVRSARPYYLEWVSEYGALYAHAGGSPKALTVIWENTDINDVNALSKDGKYFWRDTTKPAPHNLVTSSDKMVFALRDKGLLDKPASFSPWKFKDDAVLADRGADGSIVSFNFSSGKTYLVDYRYNQTENKYYRSNAGQPHLDGNTGQQLTAKNVIVQLVREPSLDNTGKGRLDIYVGGEGEAWVFRDGLAIRATWKKLLRTERTRFYDELGQEIELNRGSTWVHVLPETQTVTYQ